jgi:predicted PurR-regulated permease PerM
MLMILTGIAIYLCLRMLRPLAGVVLWSTVLAVLFAPLHDRIRARVGHRDLAAFLTLGVVVLSVLLPIAWIGLTVVSEVTALLGDAPAAIDSVVANPDARLRADELARSLRERVPFLAGIGRPEIEEATRALGEKLLQGTFGFAGTLVKAAVRFALVVFALFFLLRDGEKVAAQLRDLLPLSRRHAERVLDRAAEVIRASTFGVLLVALVQGALGGAMFALLGLRSPALWGTAMAFFAMIPMVGPGIVWLPAVAVLLFAGETTSAIVLLLWGALVVGTIDNFLRPRLIGNRTRLHELAVFFGVLGGLALFGLVGVVVGPMLFAVTASLLALARERNGAAGAAPAPVPAPSSASSG